MSTCSPCPHCGGELAPRATSEQVEAAARFGFKVMSDQGYYIVHDSHVGQDVKGFDTKWQAEAEAVMRWRRELAWTDDEEWAKFKLMYPDQFE